MLPHWQTPLSSQIRQLQYPSYRSCNQSRPTWWVCRPQVPVMQINCRTAIWICASLAQDPQYETEATEASAMEDVHHAGGFQPGTTPHSPFQTRETMWQPKQQGAIRGPGGPPEGPGPCDTCGEFSHIRSNCQFKTVFAFSVASEACTYICTYINQLTHFVVTWIQLKLWTFSIRMYQMKLDQQTNSPITIASELFTIQPLKLQYFQSYDN